MSVANGAKEIDLTSQDTGSYGFDRKTNIAELALKASQIPGDFRIRIGMLNPELLGWTPLPAAPVQMGEMQM